MRRVGLVILALSSGPIGVWATLAPRHFYDNFPGVGGWHWVAADGPYNHHLVSDFGALNLALTAVTLGALVWMTRRLIQVTAVAWLLYAVPHELYHIGHEDPVEQLVGLGVAIVIAIYLLVTDTTARERANSS